MDSQKDVKKVAQTYAKRIWDEQDLIAIDDLIDPKCIIHSSLGDFEGPEKMKKVIDSWLTGFPDLSVRNLAIISEKDLAIIQWEAKGTHLGEFKAVKPTKKQVVYSGVTIYRIANGKIVEYWAYLDMNHILSQIT